MKGYVVGVDVGTGSARAGVFDLSGQRSGTASEPIKTWKPRQDYVEQSSEDIWQAICKSVRRSLAEAGVSGDQIRGISFDATCSLVVLDKENQPLTVDLEGDNQRNIIVWMDHRSLEETQAINAGGYSVLQYVGGKLSPEMQTPKLKWLKTHLPETWQKSGKFFDLADYLTFRSTGSNARSQCTTICKWTYLGHEGVGGHWDRSYFEAIDLSDALLDDRIGSEILPMGTPLGNLLPSAAADLGLSLSCAVGVGIIDAHAGGLGLLGSIWDKEEVPDPNRLETALALIGGTSNCHMAVSRDPRFIPGIWGPYYGAMVPGMWLTEGGQSSAGSAIDHIIADRAGAEALRSDAERSGKSVYELLNHEIHRLQMVSQLPFPGLLTKDLHILPYFLGNRSPNADPYARAIVDGLTLDESITSIALLYYATLQAVAYGTRDIIRAMNKAGYRIETLFVTGGGTKNPIWLQEHADATGLTLILPSEPEAVLLGTAILAAVASGSYSDIPSAMQGMSNRGQTVRPDPLAKQYHDIKYAIFQEMYAEQLRRRELISVF